MSSVIDVRVLGDGGEQISHMRFTVDYGNEMQNVVLIIDGEKLSVKEAEAFLELPDVSLDGASIRKDGRRYDA